MPRDPEKQRAAKRRYYDRNKHVYLEKNRRKRKRMKALAREAKSVPCMDCGQRYPYFVMDFDHREHKRALIPRLINSLSLRRLEAEIAKCDVVCSNCHRSRTFRRLAG